ncbi:MerR family transcriptional regulator [Nocardia huaxiensis]|uniref:MerR family transcriptional regulator n=1 Tax=Nocardia huaxiensis TaxID=2755382 RepID=A0A7D6ZIS7_9NOCA|nr:MerR family transcriptional regulator [Nocardia huaxiensis]QLY28763.1 MerR family transcriptional regulator [Nocardia huaxiensis]UFS97764.1 MerR family transcriptional regulator [Nocardia huaxiensis]
MDSNRHNHLPGSAQAVYAISVAAELSGLAVQTLRLYEQHGLITPARSPGGTRRYSGDDLARLARITALSGQGVNLAGIGRILDLQDANTALRDTNAGLDADNRRLRDDIERLRDGR